MDKKKIIFSVVLAAAVFLPPPVQAEGTKASLTLAVSGVKNARGNIMAALCSSPEQYYGKEDPFMTAMAPAAKGEVLVKFEGVPQGKYALKVFQDSDLSGKLETGLFGIPKEKYGFSNNPKVSGGMPPFEKSSFDVSGEDVSQKITLR